MDSKQKVIIEKVEKAENGFSISTEQSTGFFLHKENIGAYVPKPGDEIELVCRNWSTIIGAYANGKLLYLKSDEQLEREHQEWLAQREREQKEDFERDKPRLDAAYDALLDSFKRRIDRFRRNCPNFRVEYEAYEMCVCETAVLLAQRLETREALSAFNDKDYKEQIAEIPELEAFGHSGNTFGASVSLAAAYIDELGGFRLEESKHNPETRGEFDPSPVVMHHAAMAMLVSSHIFDGLPE